MVRATLEHRSDLRRVAGPAGTGDDAALVPPVGAAGHTAALRIVHCGRADLAAIARPSSAGALERDALLPQEGPHLRRRVGRRSSRTVANQPAGTSPLQAMSQSPGA